MHIVITVQIVIHQHVVVVYVAMRYKTNMKYALNIIVISYLIYIALFGYNLIISLIYCCDFDIVPYGTKMLAYPHIYVYHITCF